MPTAIAYADESKSMIHAIADMGVVAGHIETRSAPSIETGNTFATSACALNHRIGLARDASFKMDPPMSKEMASVAADNLQVLWPVVGFLPVAVMDKFTLSERPAKQFLRNDMIPW
jgi:hypothetical protein